MFALALMDSSVMALFFIAAMVVFVIAAFGAVTRPNLIALALALFVIPYAYNALASS